jgi:hypothetical protein
MHVQVLKRYRDRDTKAIYEAGELVEYDNIPRIVALARGGYVEPLEQLPADAETEPATNVLTATVKSEDLKITMDHLNKVPADGGEQVVTADDLVTNPELVNAGIPPATDPAGKKKGGKPASAKTPAKKSTKEK